MPTETGTPDTGTETSTTTETGTELQAEVDKWKSLSRKHEAQAKANADAATKLQELEDAGKNEIQKARDRAAAAEARATDAALRADRMEVAVAKGLTAGQARRLVGTTREELEADADELLRDFKPAGGDGDGDTGDTSGPSTRPRERLQGGGAPDEPSTDISAADAVAKIPRSY